MTWSVQKSHVNCCWHTTDKICDFKLKIFPHSTLDSQWLCQGGRSWQWLAWVQLPGKAGNYLLTILTSVTVFCAGDRRWQLWAVYWAKQAGHLHRPNGANDAFSNPEWWRQLCLQADPYICGHRGHSSNSCGIRFSTGAKTGLYSGPGDGPGLWFA